MNVILTIEPESPETCLTFFNILALLRKQEPPVFVGKNPKPAKLCSFWAQKMHLQRKNMYALFLILAIPCVAGIV